MPLAPGLTLEPTAFSALPGWVDDDPSPALIAFRKSCTEIERRDRNAPFAAVAGDLDPTFSAPADRARFGSVADWRPICTAAQQPRADNPEPARVFFEKWFRPHRAGNNGAGGGLFTGYFEPELQGARKPDARHSVPIYRRPDDLVSVDLGKFRAEWRGEKLVGRLVSRPGDKPGGRYLEPYPTRAEIAAGALAGRGLEIAWVADPVDAFFLQIQGSGRIRLDNGQIMRIGYDGQNGRPYFAIGRELVARGALAKEEVSMGAIRAWLAAHPDERDGILALNPSYVFFRELDGDGPRGTEGVALTPGRSLAVDRRFVPLGLPLWLDTADPLDSQKPLRRLVVAQDTGAAIKGPVRGDLFWGHGPDAEERAGRMNVQGGYYLLLPRVVADKAANGGATRAAD